MNGMLAAMEMIEPRSIWRQLKQLKDGAWKPLNSYVHGGIHPVQQFHRGYSSDYAMQTLRNANGLATLAGTLLVVVSGNAEAMAAMKRAQLEHLDCLPPMASSVP